MSGYDLELDRITKEVKDKKAKVVGLQFPEGLKEYAVEVAKEIEEKTGAEALIFCDPTYGGCDLKENQTKKAGVDVLVHFGHTPYEP